MIPFRHFPCQYRAPKRCVNPRKRCHSLGPSKALMPACPIQPLKAEQANADCKSFRYVCTSCIMHKLLTHLLTTKKAAAKASCKQLPVTDLATKGKTARPRNSSLRLNPIVTTCKLKSNPAKDFARAHCWYDLDTSQLAVKHVSSSSLSLQLARNYKIQLCCLSNLIFLKISMLLLPSP